MRSETPSLARLAAGSGVLAMIPFVIFLIWSGPVAQLLAVAIIWLLIALTFIADRVLDRRIRKRSYTTEMLTDGP